VAWLGPASVVSVNTTASVTEAGSEQGSASE